MPTIIASTTTTTTTRTIMNTVTAKKKRRLIKNPDVSCGSNNVEAVIVTARCTPLRYPSAFKDTLPIGCRSLMHYVCAMH